MSKTQVRTDALVAPLGIWSQAIRVGADTELVFVSGLTSRTPDGAVYAEGDIEAQTTQVLENLQAILAAAGATMADVVKVTVFVRDIDEFATIHAVRKRYFPEPYPASTMVEVSRLVDDRSLIEIEAVAVVPKGA
jgi:2-iminobutanoate/2-iminopropanoate deaminase